MNIEATIQSLLLTMPPVVALVEQRVTAKILHQSGILPAIRVQRISEVEEVHFRGPVNMFRARVQVDSVAATGSAVDAVDAAVHGDGITTGLRTYRGTVGSVQIDLIAPDNVRETYDADELRHYRIMRDYTIWWKTV